MAKNILFIMFDQLRFDYLSCAGHPHLETPNMDWLASQGVRFSRAYVQSPVCGASRMCFYTGRYMDSHGASWNGIPLKVGELTLGDHLRAAGMDALLLGKTHMRVDHKGMARLGLAPESVIGARLAECGFDLVKRDDGLWAMGPDGNYDPGSSPIWSICGNRAMTAKIRGMIMPIPALMRLAISPLAGPIKMPACQPISARRIRKPPG